jgi:Tol biopolymer transport system component
MGEVYRARDPKLNRDVALKVLPDLVAGDADRLARFRREAQVLAALNHPNIAHIHGFEDSGPSHALVMELVEGATLADRLAQGPIGLDEALPIARQIADALEAAHDQGIVHRDLKPANVKVRDDGTVKVLDFGLAKALDPADPAAAGSVSNSPTLTARATQAGMILGTAAYMAPEQARGRAVDRRADIWAFGVVLYEMLAGRRAFEGDDISITLASVLKEDVQWSALPADLPESIRRLLRRCLEKDPKRRLSAIGDARLELDDAASPPEVRPAAAASAGIGRRERWLWAAATGLVAIAAIVFAWPARSPRELEPPLARFFVYPPGEGRFSAVPPRFAVSPDGRFLVFAASAQVGKPEQFWLRRLDSPQVTPVAGTESGINGLMPQSPFFSPDGQRLAYFMQTEVSGPTGNSRLRIVDLQGGTGRPVCELPSNNAGGSWNADGVILVSSQETKGIQRVSANGGALAPVTTLDTSRHEVAHLFPQFLPDGRHFLYETRTTDRADWATYIGSLDSPSRRLLVKSEYARFAVPNMLLYVKEENLVAQVLDPGRLELTGEPVLVATGLYSRAGNGRAGFTVSEAGVLVHSSEEEQEIGAPDRQLTWLDRNGKTLGTAAARTTASAFRLSPDASQVALLEIVPERRAPAVGSLWVTDLARNVKAPLTTGRTLALSPTWSAGSDRLLFGARTDTAGENTAILERAASGATAARTLHEQAGHNLVPLDESRDGKLVVMASGKGGLRSLHVLAKAAGTVTPYLVSEFDYPQASLSPDGKWLAYVSNESGSYEIFVQPFPDPSLGKWKISSDGGLHPRWRRDGRELFYVDADRRLIAVPIATDRAFAPGASAPLFTIPNLRLVRQVYGSAYMYDAAPDGQRFLVSLPPATASQVTPLTVTTNWASLLKK